LLGRILKIGKRENVSNGGATTSTGVDKRMPGLDSARQIGLRSHPHESSDYSVDVSTGGEICWTEIQNTFFPLEL